MERVIILEKIQQQAIAEQLRLTQHAQQEMVAEDISLDDVLEAIATGQILEYYPEHRRGAYCLLGGYTYMGRALHIVCTTANPILIIITVYVPLPPKWITPTQRRVSYEYEM